MLGTPSTIPPPPSLQCERVWEWWGLYSTQWLYSGGLYTVVQLHWFPSPSSPEISNDTTTTTTTWPDNWGQNFNCLKDLVWLCVVVWLRPGHLTLLLICIYYTEYLYLDLLEPWSPLCCLASLAAATCISVWPSLALPVSILSTPPPPPPPHHYHIHLVMR